MTKTNTPADAAPQDEREAKKRYLAYTDNHPQIHSNRFPCWEELSAEAKRPYLERAALPAQAVGTVATTEAADGAWHWVIYETLEGERKWVPAQRVRNHWNSTGFSGIPLSEVSVGPVITLAARAQDVAPTDAQDDEPEAAALLRKYRKLCVELRRGDSHHLGRIDAALAGLFAQPAAQPADAMTAHDLSTSEGARGYVAEYFATRLRRHDFSRYIAERLAADFACALARHLDGQPQRPAVASKARTQGGAAS